MSGFTRRKKSPRFKFFAAGITIIAACCCTFFAGFENKTAAEANSAQRYWRGIDSFGLISAGGECPLEVESEKLVFNIENFSQSYESDGGEEYGSTVTAEYNFYNSSDLEVTANLVFPFGSESYADYPGGGKYSGDIKVDGAPVPFNERYTYDSYGDFGLRDIEKVRDDYDESGFFTRDLTVTRYYFYVSGIEKNDKNSPYASIKLPVSFGKKYALRNGNGYSRGGNYATVGKFVKNGDTLELVVYGDADISDAYWAIYENGGEKNRIDGQVTLKYKDISTFGESVFAGYDEKFGVSRVDWFNAVVDCLNDNASDCVLRSYGDFDETFVNALMRWYEYDLTVPANGRVVNSVTAPLFPDVDADFEPNVYSYVYYSSPAQTWKRFGTLDVEINTPYYIVFDDYDNWTKTDGGYTRFYETLPVGEITFKLCSSESPERQLGFDYSAVFAGIFWACLLYGSIIVVVPLIIAAVIVIIFYKKSRKKVALKAANAAQEKSAQSAVNQNALLQGGSDKGSQPVESADGNADTEADKNGDADRGE